MNSLLKPRVEIFSITGKDSKGHDPFYIEHSLGSERKEVWRKVPKEQNDSS